MKHIFGERASGKTTACFDLCRKEEAYLVVPSDYFRELYQKIAIHKNYSDIIPRIISFNDYQELEKQLKIENKKFIIDEAGAFLYELFKGKLIGYSDTAWDYPVEDYKHLKGLISEQIQKEFYDGKEIVFKPYYEWEN